MVVRAAVGRAEFDRIDRARGDEPLSSFVRRHVLAACPPEPTDD